MRICQINNIGYEAGGAEKSVRLIRDELSRRGDDVLVIPTSRNLGDRASYADVIVPAVGTAILSRLCGRLWYQRAYEDVRRAVRQFQPDVVHLHTIGEFSPSVLAAVRQIPTLLTVHGPENYTLRLLAWQLSASDYRGGSYRLEDLTPVGRLRYTYLRRLARPAYRLGLRSVDRVLCPSRYITEAVAGDFGPGLVHRLGNGISLPPAQPFPAEPVLMYVGRLERVKGVDVLLRALPALLAAVPQARIEIAGDGPERNVLVKLAADLGVAQHVSFRGWLAPGELLREYGRAAALVIPSIWPENYPTVALEALGVGRPIIGSAVGGIPELVQDKVTGLIVPPQDPAALAQALIQVLGNLDRAREMGHAARRRASLFDIFRFIDDLEVHYRTVAVCDAHSSR